MQKQQQRQAAVMTQHQNQLVNASTTGNLAANVGYTMASPPFGNNNNNNNNNNNTSGYSNNGPNNGKYLGNGALVPSAATPNTINNNNSSSNGGGGGGGGGSNSGSNVTSPASTSSPTTPTPNLAMPERKSQVNHKERQQELQHNFKVKMYKRPRSNTAPGQFPRYVHDQHGVPPFQQQPPPAYPLHGDNNRRLQLLSQQQQAASIAAATAAAEQQFRQLHLQQQQQQQQQQQLVPTSEPLPHDIQDANVIELKDHLRRRGLPTTGRKQVLLERLLTPEANQRLTPLQVDAAVAAASNAPSMISPPGTGGTPSKTWYGSNSTRSPRFSPYGTNGGGSSAAAYYNLSPRGNGASSAQLHQQQQQAVQQYQALQLQQHQLQQQHASAYDNALSPRIFSNLSISSPNMTFIQPPHGEDSMDMANAHLHPQNNLPQWAQSTLPFTGPTSPPTTRSLYAATGGRVGAIPSSMPPPPEYPHGSMYLAQQEALSAADVGDNGMYGQGTDDGMDSTERVPSYLPPQYVHHQAHFVSTSEAVASGDEREQTPLSSDSHFSYDYSGVGVGGDGSGSDYSQSSLTLDSSGSGPLWQQDAGEHHHQPYMLSQQEHQHPPNTHQNMYYTL